MKQMTYQDLIKAPGTVQTIFISSLIRKPVGLSLYLNTVKDFPEYFPEEIERRDKWAAIPDHVHKIYEFKLSKLEKPTFSSKGILYYSQHPEESKKLMDALDEYDKIEQEIFNSHYADYLK